MACALGIEQDCRECGLCGNSPTWRCKMAKCKYPNEVCANMKVYHGTVYCGSVPCSLKDELPKKTNYEKIKGMGVEELAGFLCKVKSDYQWADHEFPSEDACGDWEEWLESECDVE